MHGQDLHMRRWTLLQGALSLLMQGHMGYALTPADQGGPNPISAIRKEGDIGGKG
jgi:hypothetical protein